MRAVIRGMTKHLQNGWPPQASRLPERSLGMKARLQRDNMRDQLISPEVYRSGIGKAMTILGDSLPSLEILFCLLILTKTLTNF